MKSDTKFNVGAVIGMGTLLLTVMVFQNASTNARFDDVETRIDDVNARIDGMQNDVNARFDQLNTRIDGLRSDMREDHAVIHMRIDATNMRLDTQQESLSEIAQRLSHVEGRLGMPRSGDGGAAPPG
ncbi:MAG: hypothetical protein OXQ29_17560 [Rhodospirillaceae bacterium]|nr:hypothetical protein [Rhodospirillaceae bacterium]